MSKNWLLEGARGRCATVRKDLNIICLFVLLFHGPSWPVDVQVAFMAPPRSCCSVFGSVAFMGEGRSKTTKSSEAAQAAFMGTPRHSK